MRHSLYDAVKEQHYTYDARDEKEERLFKALQVALNDHCPPNKADYLCMLGDAEEQDCAACLLRYATADFGIYRK